MCCTTSAGRSASNCGMRGRLKTSDEARAADAALVRRRRRSADAPRQPPCSPSRLLHRVEPSCTSLAGPAPPLDDPPPPPPPIATTPLDLEPQRRQLPPARRRAPLRRARPPSARLGALADAATATWAAPLPASRARRARGAGRPPRRSACRAAASRRGERDVRGHGNLAPPVATARAAERSTELRRACRAAAVAVRGLRGGGELARARAPASRDWVLDPAARCCSTSTRRADSAPSARGCARRRRATLQSSLKSAATAGLPFAQRGDRGLVRLVHAEMPESPSGTASARRTRARSRRRRAAPPATRRRPPRSRAAAAAARSSTAAGARRLAGCTIARCGRR